MMWRKSITDNIQHLTTNWFSFLYEERLMRKRVTVELASFCSQGSELYLSFDQSPFEKEWSTSKKWHLIEGLLKTISASGVPVRYILFLVGHRIMEDMHLDFSQPWPIEGYKNQVPLF